MSELNIDEETRYEARQEQNTIMSNYTQQHDVFMNFDQELLQQLKSSQESKQKISVELDNIINRLQNGDKE